MSDDLTRKIEELVIQIIAGMDEPEAAIAALIAEERARAFEEAAEWHDERAERTRRTLERGMSLAMRDTLDTTAYHHEQSAAAIRALAKKETADGE